MGLNRSGKLVPGCPRKQHRHVVTSPCGLTVFRPIDRDKQILSAQVSYESPSNSHGDLELRLVFWFK
jgi:hypothetical protein